MRKILAATGLFTLTFTLTTFSQTEEIHHCGTSEMMEKALLEFPDMADSLAKWEMVQQTGNVEKATKVFPIVFHIVHTYDGNWVTDAQVHSALKIINEDYKGLNADLSGVISSFQGVIGNPDFEFRLARKDPQGNCTNGITRTFSKHTLSTDDDVKTIAPQWDPKKYINVWVVSNIKNGAGGYAYLPGSAAFMPGRDGIIIRSTQFGAIGFSNNSTFAKRSLSHELGHYFNLQHTWGGSNTPGLASNCNSDDGVNDTPNTIGTAGSICNTAQNTCSSLDNVQNIMDYATCPLMFTAGQSTRMINAANSTTANRNNLSTSANLIATGTNNGYSDTICVPIADFHTSNRIVCVGTNLQIKDFSHRGNVTSYTWEVTNGTNTLTSNLQNPTFNFTAEGLYTVKLTVSNAAGSNSITKSNYIKVTSNQAEVSSNGYFDDFEDNPISSGRWFVVNETSNGWKETNAASVSGTKSLKIDNRTADSLDTWTLYSPSFNFSQITDLSIKFKYAYVKRNNSSADKLRILLSSNCGQSWNIISNLTGANLETSSPTTSNFVPLPAQWKEATINVPTTYKTQTNVRIKFEFVSAKGNNFYFDDFNIPGIASTQEELNLVNGLKVYPNPNNGDFQVSIDAVQPGDAIFKLIDISGKTVWMKNRTLELGTGIYPVQTAGLSKGIYWLNIQTPFGIFNEKVIIQ